MVIAWINCQYIHSSVVKTTPAVQLWNKLCQLRQKSIGGTCRQTQLRSNDNCQIADCSNNSKHWLWMITMYWMEINFDQWAVCQKVGKYCIPVCVWSMDLPQIWVTPSVWMVFPYNNTASMNHTLDDVQRKFHKKSCRRFEPNMATAHLERLATIL